MGEDALDEAGDLEESFDDEDLEDEDMAALDTNALRGTSEFDDDDDDDINGDEDGEIDDSYATGDLGGGSGTFAEMSDDDDSRALPSKRTGKKSMKTNIEVFGDNEDFEDLIDHNKVSGRQLDWEDGRPNRKKKTSGTKRSHPKNKSKNGKPNKKRSKH